MRSSNTSLDARARSCVFSLLCAAVWSAGTAYSMDPDRAMTQYLRDRWGPEQGFPRGTVYAIAQSNDGYLWIGTHSGLVRFDGRNFRLIRDTPGLQTGDSVFNLRADREGNLWIAFSRTLVRYRNGVFDSPAGPLSSRITAMTQANGGNLLISLMESGAMIHRQGTLEMAADATGLPRSPVLAIAQTSDGSIWSGTRGAGLFRFRDGKMISFSEGLPDPKVNCLLAGADGDLWLGTDRGIAHWDGQRIVTAGLSGVGQLQVLAMARDRDGNIWAGTDSGRLIRINQRGVAFLDPAGDRPRQAITALWEDREGNLWIGSDSGIERLRDSAFVTYSRAEGLPSDGSNSLFVDSDNRMWFSPANGGLWWMRDGQSGNVANDGLNRDVVYSIAGAKGELWLGRQHGGLTRLRPRGNSFVADTFTKAAGLSEDNIFSVYPATDGSVWAGTLSGGVSRLSAGRFTTYTTAHGLLSNTISAITETSGGTMWFATPGGLNALTNGSWHSYTRTEGLPSENVYCLLADSAGVLWIGTSAGLAFRGTGAIETPAAAPGPLKEAILGIAEDRLGSLWVATSNHVMRVNRVRLLNGTLRDGDVRDYGTADGLRGLEGVHRHRSVVADAAGRIWFSMNRGISMVDPGRLRGSTVPVIVQVQTMAADGRAESTRGSAHFSGKHGRITVGYAGLNLATPEAVRYRYRLDGYDVRWVEAGTNREASYTNLGPRRYVFRVIAGNPDGGWNSNEATVAFDVDPLYWQTGWFQMGAALALGGVVLALYRFRMRQLTERLNLRFEERLAERNRIAQELHDTLLQGFLSASMQVHVAADIVPADSGAKPILTRAMQLMRQVIDEGRNAVRGLRSSASLSLDLEHAFALVPQELAPAGGDGDQPSFRVIVEGHPKPLHPLLRDDVYRIGREALINAFRHARAKSVDVELRYFPHELRLLVRDDGRGIEPGILKSGRDGHWGLPGMRERAEQIGARLHVYSNAGAGTEVQLSVPGHIVFLSHPRRSLLGALKRHRAAAATEKCAVVKGNGK